jgi:hypothetical protein
VLFLAASNQPLGQLVELTYPSLVQLGVALEVGLELPPVVALVTVSPVPGLVWASCLDLSTLEFLLVSSLAKLLGTVCALAYLQVQPLVDLARKLEQLTRLGLGQHCWQAKCECSQ